MSSKGIAVLRSGQRTPKSSPVTLEEQIVLVARQTRARPLIIDIGEETPGRYEGSSHFRPVEDHKHEESDVRSFYAYAGKSQTPRTFSSGLLRKTHISSQSISTTPVSASTKSVHLRTAHHPSLSELAKSAAKTGTSTPRSASKPGTQRAVYNALTQKRPLQPPLIGSPRHSIGQNGGLQRQTASLNCIKPVLRQQTGRGLANYVTQAQGGSTPVRKLNLTQEQVRERSERIYREHLFQTFQALKFVKTLPPVDPNQLRAKRLFLEKRKGYGNKKTIIFDLDETLVHCCENLPQNKPDVILPITFPTGEVVNAGIKIRPFAKDCLLEANKLFEVIVFTASHQCYADVVLNCLDPTGELIHHRLYRENCVSVEGLFLKDLRVLGNRRLQDLIIVDNAAYSFSYQLDNGIPIISWHDDPYDKELYNLIDYMKILAETEDIRVVNRDTFHLNTFYEDYIDEFLGSEEKN